MRTILIALSWLYAAIVLALPAVSVGEDQNHRNWTRFQNQLPGELAASDIPLTWSPDENIAWQSKIEGYGQSSPVTWSNHIYVTSISGDKKERGHIAAFDLQNGKKIWQHDFDTATQIESTNYVSKAAPTPAVDEAGVIGFFEGGNLLALDHSGKVRWERNLVTEFGEVESRHGLAASVEQSAKFAFVWVERSTDPYVLAIDKATGKDIWKVPGIGATSWASPRLVPVEGGEHLVLSGIGQIVGLDPSTGKGLWKIEGITGNSTPTPFPIGNGKFLIGATQGRGEDAGSGNPAESNGLIAIFKQKDGTFLADYVWRAKRATSSFGSPIAHAERAYFVNATGVLFCLDLNNGEEIFNSRIAGSLWATPFAIQDRLYLPGKSGVLTIIASDKKFEKLAENEAWASSAPELPVEGAPRSMGGPTLYAAIVVGKKVLLRKGDALICISKPAP